MLHNANPTTYLCKTSWSFMIKMDYFQLRIFQHIKNLMCHWDSKCILFNIIFFKAFCISFTHMKNPQLMGRTENQKSWNPGSNLNMILCNIVYSSVMERVSKCHRHALLQHLKCKDFSTNKIWKKINLFFFFPISCNAVESFAEEMA